MEFSTRLIDWGPIMIMSNTMPPRDPDEDEEDEDEEERADEPPVVREPDEDSSMMLFRIGHSQWRIRPDKCSEDFADCDVVGFGRARGDLAR
jgi:hypothetical protein